jgi:hypothetical protein
MIMPEKPEPDVWDEARDLLLRWEALAVELGKNMASGATQNLLPLLGKRRKLHDRLDALREDYGIATWVEWPVKDRPTTAQEEIRTILSRLVVENENIRHELEERMGSLKQKIAEVRRTRVANSLYQKRRRSIKGAFIDARR